MFFPIIYLVEEMILKESASHRKEIAARIVFRPAEVLAEVIHHEAVIVFHHHRAMIAHLSIQNSGHQILGMITIHSHTVILGRVLIILVATVVHHIIMNVEDTPMEIIAWARE